MGDPLFNNGLNLAVWIILLIKTVVTLIAVRAVVCRWGNCIMHAATDPRKLIYARTGARRRGYT